MRVGVYDIEANGFLDTVDTIFCIAIKEDDKDTVLYEPDQTDRALAHLSDLDMLVGHNLLGYDNRVIKKLYGYNFDDKTVDTLLLSKLRYPFFQSHSLRAWGERFKFPKIEYNNFSYYEPEMGKYCIRDVDVTYKVFKHLQRHVDINAEYVKLEHEVQIVQNSIEGYGVPFDYDGAVKLIQEISGRMEDIQDDVSEQLGYHWTEKQHKLKKDGSLSHHAKNLLVKLQETFPEFEHEAAIGDGISIIDVSEKITLDTKKLLINRLRELGWEPEWFTDKGNPQIARKGELDPNLATNEYFSDIGEYFILKHRLGLLEGLVRVVRNDGRIPSEADILGTVTGRYAHKKIANFPAVRSLYGKEIRALFYAGSGRKQVGCDLSGIEARMLAHYMNDPEYTDEILNGDIHTKNQNAAGLPTRDDAKTFFYGFLYGAGDAKVGLLVHGDASEGKRIKKQFLESLPALKILIDNKQEEAKKGYITSLGGRPVRITKSTGFDGKMRYDVRKALNSLLQSAATVYFKKWMVTVYNKINNVNIDAHIMIAYHDELQFSVHPDDIEKLKAILQEAIEETDRFYDLKCPNDIDIKVGNNWEECH